MTNNAVKRFTIEEHSTPNMWYEIKVFFNGKLVETFLEETMKAAVTKFLAAGYEYDWDDPLKKALYEIGS